MKKISKEGVRGDIVHTVACSGCFDLGSGILIGLTSDHLIILYCLNCKEFFQASFQDFLEVEDE